jgi:branched-chain amino acid aminotransferase
MRSNGMVCVEREIRPEELLEARELFITNAIHGIRWVVSYNDKRYFNNIGKSVFRLLQEQVLQTASI